MWRNFEGKGLALEEVNEGLRDLLSELEIFRGMESFVVLKAWSIL